MKKFVFIFLGLLTAGLVHGQATYYWVGGATGNWTSAASWNTQLNGSGTSRSSAGTSDRLIIDGSNIGGSAATTGTVTPAITSSQGFGQLVLQNNATLVLGRASSGTSTFTVNGDGTADDDLVVNAGSTLSISNNVSGQSFVLQVGLAGTPATGRISGTVNINGVSTGRLVAMNKGTVVFVSGSNANVNMTASSSYPFGSATQGVEKGIVFEAGANLNYLGGFSPMGNQQAYSAIDFRPGSNWYHKVSNPASSGSFFNTKFFGNIIVENGAVLAADGPIYRIENLNVQAGGSFITHSSGHTAIVGNIIVDGSFSSQSATRNNVVILGGASQTVSGSGSFTIPSLTVAATANVTLQRDITALDTAVNIYGKINFGTSKLVGEGSFTSRVGATGTSGNGDLVAGSYQITGASNIGSVAGLKISGPGIAPNTSVVGFSGNNSTIALSQAILSNGTGVAFVYTSDTAVLTTSNPNGMDSLTGSVIVKNTKTFQNGTSYVINAATTKPLGITSGAGDAAINAGYVHINAPVTLNRSLSVYDHLTLNNKLTVPASDTMYIRAGAVINGAIGTGYVVTTANATNGETGVLQYDGIAAATVLPIGSVGSYLPVTITPSVASDFVVNTFEGITSNGQPNGTALTALEKQTVVNAVWNINRVTGSGNADVRLGWTAALEGSAFTTLPGSDIGVIRNVGTAFSLPLGTGDNTNNTAAASVSTFGAFSVGAIPQVDPFVFNPIPGKTYGDADFSGGATSLNTTQPITYTSSNTAVATIVGGNIHIVGAGTTTITASQASDGVYPAESATQLLTVAKAPLTIKADDKLKVQDDVMPTLTATYTGFVYGQNAAVLLTPVTLATTATVNSLPGTYPITAAGATSNNYAITFVPGTLTVQPRLQQTITFNELVAKTYGNAAFPLVATSTNTTIPITFTSSNTSVATISGNTVTIVGAGTTTITAAQAGNVFYFPATSVSRTLTVNKANLTIRVNDTSRLQGTPNPEFRITYTGFVNGDNASSLTTPPTASTDANINSAAGYYTVTPTGTVTSNYNITAVAGRLTVYPAAGKDAVDMNVYVSNSSTLTARLYVTEPALGDIQLYDLSGRLVRQRNVFMPVGFVNLNIAIGDIPSGIYIVVLRNGKLDLRKKVQIIH
jgi:hypothetical protein